MYHHFYYHFYIWKYSSHAALNFLQLFLDLSDKFASKMCWIFSPKKTNRDSDEKTSLKKTSFIYSRPSLFMHYLLFTWILIRIICLLIIFQRSFSNISKKIDLQHNIVDFNFFKFIWYCSQIARNKYNQIKNKLKGKNCSTISI